jgi:hypothetical protein
VRVLTTSLDIQNDWTALELGTSAYLTQRLVRGMKRMRLRIESRFAMFCAIIRAETHSLSALRKDTR